MQSKQFPLPHTRHLLGKLALATALVGAAAPASASAPEIEEILQKGMSFVEAGRKGDPEAYRQCGEHFLAAYHEFGEAHKLAASLLWNTAECFEAAGLSGQSIHWRAALLAKFPQSEHYQKSLERLARQYQALAMYSQAAQHMELYAAKYPTDIDSTPNFLRDAYLFRLGLGQDKQAAAILAKYEQLYARNDPERAAGIFWSWRDQLTTDDDKLRHARQYLKIYGLHGGHDRRIVAEANIGQILWRQSCNKGLLHDSCISIKRKLPQAGDALRAQLAALKNKTTPPPRSGSTTNPKLPASCDSPSASEITVHTRDKNKADEAQRYFDNALALAKGAIPIPEDDHKRRADFADAVAMSRFYKADRQYEEYLQVEIPRGLTFFVEAWKRDSGLPKWEKEYRQQLNKKEDSEWRFLEFYKRKSELALTLQKQYDGIVSARSSLTWMIAAAARSALVSQNYADQLDRAEVPKEFTTNEQITAFCHALSDKARPIQEDALKKFAYCLERSTIYQAFTAFSRLCEEELQWREPDKYPATDELFGVSEYTASRPDLAPVQLEPPPTPTGSRPE